VFVPHDAMSGGTLIALSADEIVMDPNAVLGPVDPQIGDSPAASILTVLERKKPYDIEDKTLILADVGRKAMAQVARTAQDLLSDRMAPDQAAALTAKLATAPGLTTTRSRLRRPRRSGWGSVSRCRTRSTRS
jgi:ClpP class serine protease